MLTVNGLVYEFIPIWQLKPLLLCNQSSIAIAKNCSNGEYCHRHIIHNPGPTATRMPNWDMKPWHPYSTEYV